MDSARTAPPRPSHPQTSSHQYQPQTYGAYPPAPTSTHPLAGQSQPAPSPVTDSRYPFPRPTPQQPPVPPSHPYSQSSPAAHQSGVVHSYHPPSAYSTHLPSIRQFQPQPPQYAQEPSGVSSRPQSGPQAHEGAREEHTQYSQHNRSGHATPAPIAQRTYSHEQQHTPLTPAPAGPHHTGPAAEPSQQPMDNVMHHGYAHHNGVHHGLPPHHASPHEPHGSYASTPVMDHNQYAMQQQQQMYPPPGYGPASQQAHYATAAAIGKRKPMRAQQVSNESTCSVETHADVGRLANNVVNVSRNVMKVNLALFAKNKASVAHIEIHLQQSMFSRQCYEFD